MDGGNEADSLNEARQRLFRTARIPVEEVEKAIRSSSWQPAEKFRLECELEFPFAQDWNGHRSAWKKVNPILVEEESEIVVITVYTFYY